MFRQLYDSIAWCSRDESWVFAAGAELDAGGGCAEDDGAAELGAEFVVDMSAADELDAGFFAAPDIEHFAAFESDCIHPDAADLDRGVVAEEEYSGGIAALYDTSGPVDLSDSDASGYGTWQVGIESDAEPAIGFEDEGDWIGGAAGRNAVIKDVSEQRAVVVVTWDLPESFAPGVQQIGDGEVAVGEFVVCMVARDDQMVGVELLIVDMLEYELQ
jgi:hypothetical protein